MKKTLAAAALVTAPALGWASPAAAATANFEQEVTFSYQGNEITCTFHGYSTYNYDEEQGETLAHGGTGFGTQQTDSPECQDAVDNVIVGVNYKTEEGDDEGFGGQGFGEYVGASGNETGTITEVFAVHTANYACDDPDGYCTSTFTTNPK